MRDAPPDCPSSAACLRHPQDVQALLHKHSKKTCFNSLRRQRSMSSTSQKERLGIRLVLRALSLLVLLLAFFVALTFVTAGRLDYWQGWIFNSMNILFLLVSFIVLRDRKDLIKERQKPGKGMKKWDKPVSDALAPYFAPRVSPDGTRAAYCFIQGKQGISVIDIERKIAMPLTTNQPDFQSIWTPDSSRVAFTRTERPGLEKIMWIPSDGSGEAETLVESETDICPSSRSPQGDLLAYVKYDPATDYDIWVLRLKDRKSEAFLSTQFAEAFPEFSPDGHWMAYVSYETGQREVYVRPYPGPGQKIKVSSERGWIPCWGPGGRQLYYLSGNRILNSHKLMVIDTETTPNFYAGTPRLVMDCLGYGLIASTVRGYDIHPDGKRFLGWGDVYGGAPIRRSDLPEELLLGLGRGDSRRLLRFGYWLKMGGQRKLSPDWEALDLVAAVTEIKIVQNWFEELKRLVPSGKK